MSDVVQLEGEGASIALSGDGSTIQLILREGGGGGAVDSVNGQTGTVSLDLDDLTDVDTTTDPPDADDVLAWDGVTWTPATLTALGAPGLSNATPADLGTAAPGVSTEASRADHVHDLPTAADVGAAASSHVHSGADITSGTVATARLGSGTANATTFLRGDGTWSPPFHTAALISTTQPNTGPTHATVAVSNSLHYLTATGRQSFVPVFVPAGTYDSIWVSSTVAAASTWRLGIYAAGSDGYPSTLLLDAGTVDMSVTPGWLGVTGLSFVCSAPRWMYLSAKCVAYTAAPTVHVLDGISSAANAPRIPGWPSYGQQQARSLVGLIDYAAGGGAALVDAPAFPSGSFVATQSLPLVSLRRSA